MAEHIKTYATLEDWSHLDLSDPWVAYIESINQAKFSKGIDIGEMSFDEDAKLLLNTLVERVTKLENGEGSKSSGVFLLESEYSKLIAGQPAVDEEGNIIVYDSATTYYTYEDSEPVIVVPTVGPDGMLGLTAYTVGEDNFLDLSSVAKVDEDGYLYFSSSQGGGSYVTGDTLTTNATVDAANFLNLTQFGQIDENGFLILE